MKALIPSFLLLFSCTKYASVEKESFGTHTRPVEMKIHHLTEHKWYVGQTKEETVSQSFTFIVDMPRIRKDDLNFLTKQKGIDSWIIRLIFRQGSEEQDLGSLYTLFRPR